MALVLNSSYERKPQKFQKFCSLVIGFMIGFMLYQKIFKKVNWMYYAYKRNNWMLDFSRYFRDFRNIKIDRPIFLLGMQGGGLTIISRMIRRNKNVVSVTGNYKYWYGADEMQNVLWPILPLELRGVKHHYPASKKLITAGCGIYAADEVINFYRKTKDDVTPELKQKFQKIIRWLIARYAISKDSARFIDKSQIFTIKVSFINELLKEAKPKFLLIVRNPYALCRPAGSKELLERYGPARVLDFAAQHWANSVKYALGDGKEIENFRWVRLEDILREPQKRIKKICNFLEIKYNSDMIPQSHHKIGLGVHPYPTRKWYPLRREVNKVYFQRLTKQYKNIIAKRCQKYADKFGYSAEKE